MNDDTELVGMNPRYRLYCLAHGYRSQAEQVAADRKRYPGGAMAGFILWNNEQVAVFCNARGIPRDADAIAFSRAVHAAGGEYDRWLAAGYVLDPEEWVRDAYAASARAAAERVPRDATPPGPADDSSEGDADATTANTATGGAGRCTSRCVVPEFIPHPFDRCELPAGHGGLHASYGGDLRWQDGPVSYNPKGR